MSILSPQETPAADVPVPADYDGDGVTDQAGWNPATGTWRIQPSQGGPAVVEQWGQAGDLPVPAAYDGRVDLAVLRPSEGTLLAKPLAGGEPWTKPWGGIGGTPAPADHPGMATLASVLLALAARLSAAGRAAEAVEPAKQAREVLRRLASADVSFRAQFASASVLYGAYASNAQLHDEAVTATEEGVGAYRDIGDQPGLAWALENLAMRCSTAGRFADAVPPARECRDVYRALAQADPAQRENRARAAVMLGAHASNAQLHDEAIAATEEGVGAYRDIGDRPGLAWALENLAMRFSTAGRFADAVPPARECREVYRTLSKKDHAQRGSWARTAVMLGAHEANAKHYDEAIDATREGVHVFRELFDRPGLAWALENLAMRFSTAGRFAEAVPPARECRTLYRELSAANAAYQPSWGTAAVMLGAHEANAKHRGEAITATQEGVGVFRDLANRPSLAWALQNLATRFGEANKVAEAVVPQRECRDIYRALTETASATYQPSWAQAALTLAYLLAGLGRRAEALNAALEAVRLYQQLVKDNPAYAPQLDVARQLVASLQGLVNEGALIAAVHAPATAAPGEPVTVTVELSAAAPADTLVTINGLSTRETRLQASSKPGAWRVPVTAVAGGQQEERALVVDVTGRPATPRLDIVQNPFRPLSVFVRAVEIDDENPVLRPDDTYRWLVGSTGYPTSEPVFTGDLGSIVDHARPWTPVPVRLDVVRADGSTLSVERTLVLGSSYRLLRDELGQIRPPVTTDGQAVQVADRDSRYRGVFTVANLEPVALRFDRRRVEWTGDEDEATLFGPEETLDVTVEPGGTADVEVVLDRSRGHGAHGALVHLFGRTADGAEVHSSAAFSLVRPPRAQLAPHPGFAISAAETADPGWAKRFAAIVNDRPAAPVTAEVGEAGTVTVRAASPRGLTQEDVWTLKRAAVAAGHDGSTGAWLGAEPAAAPAGEVVQDGDCDPDNPPDVVPANFACQFTGEYTHDEIPARVVNARKGDIVLVPGGNGMIGGLLAQVTPAQRYAHCGIMTKNFVEISHSTASEEWLSKEHPRGVYAGGGSTKAPTDGFEPDAARFQWPGGITQSVTEAYGGIDRAHDVGGEDLSRFVSPGGIPHKLSAFNLVDAAVLDGQWQIIEPMVLKPHPAAELADPTLRQRLHQVADQARSLTVTADETRAGQQSKTHYRFYCYTDSAVAVRPSPSGVVGPAPDTAGWAAGTVPTECASFIWLSARRAGVRLEGPGAVTKPADLELPDLQAGAQVDDQTLDGLYFYTAEERTRAAHWFVPFLEEKIFLTARDEGHSWLEASVNELFSDMGDDCAYQLANTFAFDWADGDSKNSDAWENPGVGRAVSPDNLMLWDRPEQTGFGLWGYAEPLVHHNARLEPRPVTKWRKTDGPALLTGTVSFNGVPEAGAEVNAGGVTAITDAGGRFSMDVFEGHYLVQASKFVSREVGVATGTLDLTLKAGDVRTVDIPLKPPPDRYRLVQITARIDMRDDEFSANPFEDDPDEYAHDQKYWELRVDPEHGTDQVRYQNGWGGEERADVTLKATLNPEDSSVTLELTGTMYEGDNEQTNDFGGSASASFVIPKDAANVTKDREGRDVYLKIWNTADNTPDDNIEFRLTVTNRTQL
ncbi:tetratricopeptide repeat protein [Amycolatopsis sp. cmx-4-68]|uniref:tetratricopeptide repeat protein n=1 Tax=Amycolatopsis sp. cmx-4-68 TaxID=2790938 RepID=UPI00397DB7E8